MLPNNTTPLAQIRKITLNNLENFVIDLADTSTKTDYLTSTKILRCVPGKRISCVAEYRNKIVFAKIFFDSKRAQKHWQKEKDGVELLAKSKILTPELIAHYSAHGPVYVLLFKYHDNAINFQQRWDESNADQQIQLLSQLLALIAKHHNNKILQKDLHLENFIFDNYKLYTLDGSEIIQKDTLSEGTLLNNLALLFAQFFPENDANMGPAMLVYLQIRNSQFVDDPIASVKRLTIQKRIHRKNKFIAKTIRECSAFVVRKTGRYLYICDRNFYNKAFKLLIEQPDEYCQQGEVIKNGNTCTVFKLNFQGTNLLVKRYNIKNWRHRLSRLFRQSRAMHSWVNAHLLKFYGIKTPHPIAIIENRFGPLRGGAYLITEFLPGESCDVYFNNQHSDHNKQLIANKITSLLTGLINLFIAHGDLKANNILINDGQPYLIDLDSMKQYTGKKSYAYAGEKDRKRFIKNWGKDEKITRLFTQ